MDPLPEHETITGGRADNHEVNERVLDRLRRNDPTLNELTIAYWSQYHQQTSRFLAQVLQILDAIATNSSLKVLDLHAWIFLDGPIAKDRLTRALITNTSVKHLRLRLRLYLRRSRMPGWVTEVLDIVRASPNLEALTLKNEVRISIEDIAAMVQWLCAHTNLHSLTLERFVMNSNCAAAFAAAFEANQTIKTLIMRNGAIQQEAVVSFAEALPHDHSLETIIFDRIPFNDDSVVSIIRTLCHKHLKNLSLVDNGISQDQDGCDRIVQILKENKHSFVKLDLFPDDADSLWQNKIRLEIDELTWNNYLQVEKDKWLDQFLGQDARTKELLFRALERAKKLDNERFSKAPNMLFHLVKQLPDSIVQAMHDGHKRLSVTMSPPLPMAQNTDE